MSESLDDKALRKLNQAGMDGYLARDENERQRQARERTDTSGKQEQAKKRLED